MLRSNLDAQQTGLRGKFVVQKLVLSSSFKCDRIHNSYCYHSGHTLLCCLSETYKFNKQSSEAGLLNKSSCLAAALGGPKLLIIIWSHFVVLLKSDLDIHKLAIGFIKSCN